MPAIPKPSRSRGASGLIGFGERGIGWTAAASAPAFTASIFNPARPDGVRATARVIPTAPGELDIVNLQDRVDQLVRAYRVRGHVVAKTDPLGAPARTSPSWTRASTASRRPTWIGPSPPARSTARREHLAGNRRALQNTYCRSIGVQYMHIDQIGVRHWLQDRMEGTENRVPPDAGRAVADLTRLTTPSSSRSSSRKSSSAPSVSPWKAPRASFRSWTWPSRKPAPTAPARSCWAWPIADGSTCWPTSWARARRRSSASSRTATRRCTWQRRRQVSPGLQHGLGHGGGRKVHLSLCFNPATGIRHPVVEGRVRAKQDRYCDNERHRGMAFLIHGDAAFAGEASSRRRSTQRVGRLLHRRHDSRHRQQPDRLHHLAARGTLEPLLSAVAKMLQIPIFHVNGEDPEAVAR